MLYNSSITSSVRTAISEVENGCYVGNGDMGNGDMGNGDVGRQRTEQSIERGLTLNAPQNVFWWSLYS